jgi:hypothetical protein
MVGRLVRTEKHSLNKASSFLFCNILLNQNQQLFLFFFPSTRQAYMLRDLDLVTVLRNMIYVIRVHGPPYLYAGYRIDWSSLPIWTYHFKGHSFRCQIYTFLLFNSQTDIPCLKIENSSSNSWTENAPSPPSLIQVVRELCSGKHIYNLFNL